MTAPVAPDDRVDFETAGTVAVENAEALQMFFSERDASAAPVRLCGTATRQRELPAPERVPTLVSTARMTRITRLEPDDLTCSVEPGLPRTDLDAALAEKHLRLPCAPSSGTVGGMFALGREAWPEAPGALGSLGARSLLLGLSGVLAEGKLFKAGARVVKSVAGFDLHKLFVGSRGTLFAATELHLKLRPLPRAIARFAMTILETERAVALFRALRLDDHPPAAVRLLRDAGGAGFTVTGRFEGSARVVQDRMRAHELEEVPEELHGAEAHANLERLAGLVPPSRVPELLALLPDGTSVRVGGTGYFRAFLTPLEVDAVLPKLPGIGVSAELDLAPPGRRGRATPTDPGAERIRARLENALDPHDVLT